MQKAESLSFQTLLGLEGCVQSLVNKISIRAKSLRSGHYIYNVCPGILQNVLYIMCV
jgi:hypothetical protein